MPLRADLLPHAARVLSARRSALAERTRAVPTLTAEAMLADEGTRVWRTSAFEGAPSFYPVYRHGDAYAFSPLDLVLSKGRYAPVAAAFGRQAAHDMVPTDVAFEAEIERVGGPPRLTGEITDPQDYARAFAAGVRDDAAAAEAASNAERNVVLCGGKDSLNLLLLPWSKPVTAYSAQPNTDLVRGFVEANGLRIEVRELDDRITPEGLAEEAAEGLGRVDLSHWKWAGHLRAVAAAAPTLFWKGQVADAFTTDYWKIYRSDPSGDRAVARRAWRKLSARMPARLDAAVSAPLWQALGDTMWRRAARGQGDHLGFLRALTGSVFRSAYHGPAAAAVWGRADLTRVARFDIRDRVGEALLGRRVTYPSSNPGPGPSDARRGLNDPALVAALLRAGGVEVRR